MGNKSGKAKRRNKQYHGADAKRSGEVVRVRKISAVVRSDYSQWIIDHQTQIKYGLIAIMVMTVIIAGLWALLT